MATYIIPTGKINHVVTIKGNLMTGDTYSVKDIIKQFFGGKWDAQRRGWLVDAKDIDRWMGTKIKPAADKQPSRGTYNPARWQNADGSLAEDF